MKKFLGIISILYSILIIYLILNDKLKYFLAPNMCNYIKISLIPMVLMGLIIISSKNTHYTFKISDLFLLLPLVMFMFIGDGKLSANLASNRVMNSNKSKTREIIQTEIKEEKKEYDFSNPYFKLVDENYDALSNYLSYEADSNTYIGKTIKVKGFALKNASYIPDGYFVLGKYSISCCVADATFTGFFIKYDLNKIKTGSWYDIEGILKPGIDNDGYNIMYIEVINIKEINSKGEAQYIYPCYAYGDNNCEKIIEKLEN